MESVRIVVASCAAFAPIRAIWHECLTRNWPECRFPVSVVAPTVDVGWNANLLEVLRGVAEPLVLLMMDDHFISRAPHGFDLVVAMMLCSPEIGLVKLQAGNAANPDLPFKESGTFREYDRKHHPFKRTNLVPTLFRLEYLRRLAGEVLRQCGPEKDKGRQGALEFEVEGTVLTKDAVKWPERMLGIDRSAEVNKSVIQCIASDGVREGKLKPETLSELAAMGIAYADMPGIERFL